MRKWYPMVLLLISISASIFAYPRLPESVATHWSSSGEVNGYSSRLVATVIFPILLLAIWGFMRGLPRVDPWRPNYSKMQGAYDLVVNAGITAGIRTPWTLTNARVWERTHRVGGYLMVAAGVLGIVAVFLPIEIGGAAIVTLALTAGLISVTYSYFAWRQETSR